MPLSLTCPACRGRLQIPEQHAGRKVKCPLCAGIFEAQAESAMPAPAPPRIPAADRRDSSDEPAFRLRPEDDYDDAPRPRRPRNRYDDERRPRERYDDDPRPRRPRDDYDDYDDEPRPRRRKKTTNTGMIVGMIVGGAVLLIAVIVLIVVLVMGSDRLPGSTWEGNETLPGFGRLEFQFKSKGQCIMIDARDTVQGKFTQSGKNVTITFKNAVYEGTINGDTMSGTAHPIGRPGFGLPPNWTWSVKRR